jgi:hypothetical protein
VGLTLLSDDRPVELKIAKVIVVKRWWGVGKRARQAQGRWAW